MNDIPWVEDLCELTNEEKARHYMALNELDEDSTEDNADE